MPHQRIDVRKPPDKFDSIAYRSGMVLTASVCYRAVLARDARYDGRFFTCVKTTGIYCRPICPARPPKLDNCRFVPTAAAAQEAGFRPCLRCRPESSPDLDAWRGTSATVSRALKLIESGALDEEGDVASLADRLAIGERHLRRLFRQHVGAAPITVAQTRRVLLAKQLIHQTHLSMIQIALAGGFGSVRRFNEVFQQLYNRPPSELRRHAALPQASPSPEISLLLTYRPPYDWESMLRFLRARAINGLESISANSYSRVIQLGDATGSMTVSNEPMKPALRVTVRFPRLSALPMIISRIRRMFDLSADPIAIGAALLADSSLAPLIKVRPGLRLPGGWSGFEIAVRAILGQQITVKGATQLATRIVAAMGERVVENPDLPELTHAFPLAERFEKSALQRIGMPRSRAAALEHLASAFASNPHLFDPRGDLDQSVSGLLGLPGIGEWTAQYIAMRAMGESDAFLPSDVGIQRALACNGRRPAAKAVSARAEKWRPWRAYAMLHLWMAEPSAAGALSSEKVLSKREISHAFST